MTTLTSQLSRWSTKSNRRRVVETMAWLVPWALFAAAAAWFGFAHGMALGVATAAIGAVVVIAAGIAFARKRWQAPATIAEKLDREQKTADLLQTALEIETRGTNTDEPFEPLVLERARAFAPSIDSIAVDPIKLRASWFGGAAAVGMIAVIALADRIDFSASDEVTAPAKPTHVLGERDKAQAKAIGDAIESLSKDHTLSGKVREHVDKARQALRRARDSKTGNQALAALSDASRELDEAAKELSKSYGPDPSALAKMDRDELASELAKMAKSGDPKLSALAREALHRSAMSSQESKALAEALKNAIAKQGGDPTGKAKDASAAGQRMQQLANAADQMARNDQAGAKSNLGDLARQSLGNPQPRDARMASLDKARQAVSKMHADQRSAMNAQNKPGSQDSKADAARQAAMAKAGSGAGSGQPQGQMSGSGNPGSGAAQGGKPGQMAGAPSQGPPNGPPQIGNGPPEGSLSVLQGPNMSGSPGGSSGTSGSPGNKSPAGSSQSKDGEESSMAEEVATPPPVTPDGVIRAIREHSEGEHASEQFEPVRDHYQAIAEAAMHRDQIPLTRRDFIQRYFEALRKHEGP